MPGDVGTRSASWTDSSRGELLRFLSILNSLNERGFDGALRHQPSTVCIDLRTRVQRSFRLLRAQRNYASSHMW
jgi:hypothetical protein